MILTTAYHEYALVGYELNVLDYLLKPFEFERFLAAVNKVKKQTQSDTTEAIKDYLFVNIQLKKVKIHFSQFLYIESQKEYVRIVTLDSAYMTKMSTHEIENFCPNHYFNGFIDLLSLL
ncbi:MAG: hypothetical protein U5K54_26265 [Cytophagales bacterium]|nr:hypothetical protein [Cytophagales bacterium]